ncbi:hypothetical protein [Zhihengliuella halotolerans]|uniref:Major capsid protein n=1 Tax=Zhihengliuella halotolerans TaxID=370736 RepID=A0A4V6MGF3_9MICC|nr:hypothetical protein [Zhihengliuella halotolerans]RZU61746.1 hypothetical protein EV380_1324 [Zhihengliuella halotolerans]
MSYTYPAPPATVTQDGQAVEIHQFLKSPTLIARRLRDLTAQKFIADYLLSGRFKAQGGSILYENGESLFAADDPEAVAPGADYPTTVMTSGELQAAKTVKWGRDSIVTDEAISRLLMNPVERGLLKLANTTIRHVDSVALGVIASKVTQTFDCTNAGDGNTGAWTSAEAVIAGTLAAKAKVEEENVGEGYDLNVVVLKPTQYALVMSKLLADGVLPRESSNPINSGEFPNYLGLTWTTTAHTPVTNPLLVDNTQLGGMADEDIKSPGYSRIGGVGLETKSIRDEDNDRWKIRARRVTVPVVTEPNAAIEIVNTGIGG